MFIYFSEKINQDIIGRETPHLDRKRVKVRQTFRGASGGEGLLWSMGEPTYDPSAQTWQQIGGDLYIGYSNLPKASELIRNRIIDGHDVILGDGDVWRIPVARLVNGDTMLPQVLRKSNDGKVVFEIAERYKKLYDFADNFWRIRMEAAVVNAAEIELTFEDIFSSCAEILSINYMVSETEISIMGLITTENIRDFMDAVIDIPSLNLLIESYKKKRLAAGG